MIIVDMVDIDDFDYFWGHPVGLLCTQSFVQNFNERLQIPYQT